MTRERIAPPGRPATPHPASFLALCAALLFAALLVGGGSATLAAENIDPAGDDHQYAWGSNVDWINLEPLGDGGPGVEVSDLKLVGWMWGSNDGWINMSCENTGVCGVSPFGVLNDGYGNLSGYAWGTNDGWINFAPTTCAGDPACGVKISPVTGYFSGMAWGSNIGWMNFSSPGPELWTTRTSWCQGVGAAPSSSPSLSVAKQAAGIVLSWSSLPGASFYDLVGGKLSTLKSSGGNFTISTDRCVSGKRTTTSAPETGQAPSVGDGVWFLVRGANCKGRGTYDSGAPSQVGSRDAEIAASLRSCP